MDKEKSGLVDLRLEEAAKIGARIKEAAERIGGLQELAPLLTDVSRRTLSDYVSGKSEPKTSTLREIIEATGVTVQWLMWGTGPMSIRDAEKAHRPTIDQTLFAELLLLVKAEHDQASIYLSNESLVRTTVDHYNAMVLQAEDPADHEELKSLVPWAHRRIKRLIAAAKAEPGTGKRSAS